MSQLVSPEVRTQQLSNGLRVCLIERRQAPVVATALCYRAGTLDERPGQEGLAHFLEHMMFRGSSGYGAGEIDRLTQALGGSNNAYTSHDCTAYFFSFARDRWTTALEIEADRLSGLTLDPAAVEAERAIILEEVKMHQDDPWDALEEEVRAALYEDHPYGRPILGTPASLRLVDRESLVRFRANHYRPENAVLAIAGDLGREVFHQIERAFAGIPAAGDAIHRAPRPVEAMSSRRLERRQGSVARLLWAVRGPSLRDRDFPAMRVLAAILGSGRASRLNRRLVEEENACAFVSVEITETLWSGALLIAAEAIPESPHERAEQLLSEELQRASEGDLRPEELSRAKSLLSADWVFRHEQVQEVALTIATAATLMDVEFPARHQAELLNTSLADVERVAARYLGDSPRIVGWSLPAERQA